MSTVEEIEAAIEKLPRDQFFHLMAWFRHRFEDEWDRQEWLAVSAVSLEAAYGDSEPDYSPSLVRESNPDYGHEGS